MSELKVFSKEGVCRNHETRCAIYALERVLGLEGCLERCQSPGALRKALDRRHLGAVGLDREHQARAYRVTVEQHRARAADTVLAAQMRASQTQIVTQEVRKGSPRLHRAGNPFTVDRHSQRNFTHVSPR